MVPSVQRFLINKISNHLKNNQKLTNFIISHLNNNCLDNHLQENQFKKKKINYPHVNNVQEKIGKLKNQEKKLQIGGQ